MKVRRMRKGLALLLMAAMLLVLVPAAAYAAAPAEPTATPGAGEVVEGTSVAFQCTTDGATISYSTDGGSTWTDGDSYTVDADVTVQVKATNTDGESPVASFAYTVRPADPTPDLAPGLVARGTTVTFSSTAGADITIDDGTLPVTESTYVVNDNVTLSVKASKNGRDSNTVDFTYTVKDTIADVRAACDETNPGLSFVIEGTLTSNAFNYTDEQLAAATDCRAFNNFLYVQDATAGIRCVRSAIDTETNQLVGAKVRVKGTTDVVNGEPVLDVTSLTVLEASTAESVTAITPTTTVSAAVVNDQTDAGAQGKLVAVSGTIVAVEKVSEKICNVRVKAVSNTRSAGEDEVRLYIDPTITTGTQIACCVPGAEIVAAGIAAYDESYTGEDGLKAFLRIRDRADLVCEPADPTADVTDGIVDSGTVVTFSCATEGAEISYSTDGGNNWTTDTTITLTADTNIEVKATKDGKESTATFIYTIKVKPATPTADVASGEVESGKVVTFACETAGAEISYSTDDGTTWTKSSTITLTADTTVKVKATKDATDSDLATFTYTIKAPAPEKPATPTADVASGEVDSGKEVTFACETAGAEISYSTDNGTTWTKSSTITLTADTTVKVKATLGTEESDLATFTYTIKAPAPVKPATPTASVPSGSEVESGTNIQFACATEGATIQISLDGKTWTDGTGIVTDEDVTVYVKAKLGTEESDLATFTYTIKAPAPAKPATPTANVATGSAVPGGTTVTFTTATEGAKIFVSTDDGKTWEEKSSITVNAATTVKVKATKDAVDSEIASFTYKLKPAAPTASVASGEVDGNTVVTFTTTTEDATINYSTDNGKTWREGHSITLTAPTTVKVKAVKDEVDSDIASFSYTIKQAPEKPTATPEGGPKDKPAEAELGTTVTFSCATEGAVIYYRFSDEDTWTAGDSYVLDKDRTIQLKAVRNGLESEAVSYSYKTYVLLNANGGAVSETRAYTADGSLPALPLPSQRDGYIFGGWYDSEKGGNQMIQGESPAGKMTLYAHWYELSSSVKEGAVVPAALTGTYASVDAMRNTMLKTVQRRLGTTAVKGSKLYEVSVQYYDSDLGTWLPILASQFPTAGVKVAIGFPSGAAGTDRFVALHLFGEDCNGHRAGEGEMPTITANGGVLNLTVHGTSPLLLVWTATGSGSGTTPKTGDESNLAVWGGMMIASFTAMLGAPVILRRKKAEN